MTLQYRVQTTAIFSVISVLLSALFSILFVVYFEMGAVGKVLGMFPGVILFFTASFYAIRKFSRGQWSFHYIKLILKTGFPLIIAIWSYEILHMADRYILERLTDMKSVGLYSFAYTLSELPMILILGVLQLWNPIFYENMNKKSYNTIKKLITLFITLLTVINLSLILFAKELVVIFINQRYYEAIPIIAVIVSGVYFNGLITITNSILGFQKRFGFNSILAGIASISNIILNFILIPQYGIIGSAFATLFAYFLYFIIGAISSKPLLQKIVDVKTIAVPVLVIAIGTITSGLFYDIFGHHNSMIEIFLKLIVFILSCISFFGFKIITIKDFGNSLSLFSRSK